MNINTINPNTTQNAGNAGQINFVYDDRPYAPLTADIAGSGSAAYPEIYYKLQPHILMACDQMDAGNVAMTKHLMDNAADNIRANVMRTNPEVAGYTGDGKSPNAMPEAREAITYGYGPGSGIGYDSSYQSRGFLRDLIDILLLAEYYRRRRYPYY